MKALYSFVVALLLSFPLFAQKDEPLIPPDVPLTWLGIDFTQTRFLGPATGYGESSTISAQEIRDKYAPGWNQLFVDEMKKYNVAKYTDRESVEYALEVTGRANKNIGEDFFSKNEDDYERLKEDDIKKLVAKYDFMGRKGVGLMFFVEGIDKNKEAAAAWVAVVDMDKKQLLGTRRETAKAGGFGFRNYWAKSFLGILKDAGH